MGRTAWDCLCDFPRASMQFILKVERINGCIAYDSSACGFDLLSWLAKIRGYECTTASILNSYSKWEKFTTSVLKGMNLNPVV